MGSPLSAEKPRPLGSISTICRSAGRLCSASDASIVRASAVLPLPVVPAISTCTTLGAGSRSSSGCPDSSTPSTAVPAGIPGRLRCSVISRTGEGSRRGTSICITAPSRAIRTRGQPRAKAISSPSPVILFSLVSGCGRRLNWTKRGVTTPPWIYPGALCRASTASMQSACCSRDSRSVCIVCPPTADVSIL